MIWKSNEYLRTGDCCHHGLDFTVKEDLPVLVIDKGAVIQVGYNGEFGLAVNIRHIWGESLYVHLKEIKVVKDQNVEVGEQLGLSSQSGTPLVHTSISASNQSHPIYKKAISASSTQRHI